MFRLKAFRKQEGLTQKDLALMVGVSENYIQQLEGKRRPMTHAFLKKLASAFKLKLQVILK